MNLDTSFRGGRVPSLGIVEAALWIAWITLIYSADLSLVEGGVSRQSTSSAFLYSTSALGVTLIALSFAPAWARRYLLARRPLALSSCIAAAMTLVVLNGSAVAAPVFAVCAAATGCLTALLGLRLAIVFSEVESRGMLMGMPEGLLSFVMAAAVILCVAGSLFLLRRDDIVRLMEPVEAQGPAGGAGTAAPRSAGDGSAEMLDASALDSYQASLQRLCAILGIDFGLSAREVDVLELLVLGKDAKAIADELFISFNTVRSHIRRIYGKLDVHSRQELLDKVRGQTE